MKLSKLSQFITLVSFLLFSKWIIAEPAIPPVLDEKYITRDAYGNIISISPEFRAKIKKSHPSRIIMKHTDEDDDEDFVLSQHKKLNAGKEHEQRNDLREERLINFHHIVLSDTSIGVNFTVGSKSCFGYRAVLEEKDDSIGIAVIEGMPPGATHACSLLMGYSHFVLHTKKPIGNRKIIHLLDVDLKP